jgi:hypothetical protein
VDSLYASRAEQFLHLFCRESRYPTRGAACAHLFDGPVLPWAAPKARGPPMRKGPQPSHPNKNCSGFNNSRTLLCITPAVVAQSVSLMWSPGLAKREEEHLGGHSVREPEILGGATQRIDIVGQVECRREDGGRRGPRIRVKPPAIRLTEEGTMATRGAT